MNKIILVFCLFFFSMSGVLAADTITVTRPQENQLYVTWANKSGQYACLELVKPFRYFVGCTENDNYLNYIERDANVIPHTGDTYRLYFTDDYFTILSEEFFLVPGIARHIYLPEIRR